MVSLASLEDGFVASVHSGIIIFEIALGTMPFQALEREWRQAFAVLAMVAICATDQFAPGNMLFVFGIPGLLAVFLVWRFIELLPPPTESGWVATFGGKSYALCLSRGFVIRDFDRAVFWSDGEALLLRLLAVAVSLAGSLAVALGLHAMVEKPFLTALRKRSLPNLKLRVDSGHRNFVCFPLSISTKALERSKHVMDTKTLHEKFWKRLSDRFREVGAIAQPDKPTSKDIWMVFGFGHHKIHPFAVRSVKFHTIRLGVQWNGKTVEESARYFDHLDQYKADIHRELGFVMVWKPKKDMKRSTIETVERFDIPNEADWPDQIDWMRKKLDRIHEVFKPRVDGLNLDD